MVSILSSTDYRKWPIKEESDINSFHNISKAEKNSLEEAKVLDEISQIQS